MADRVRTPAKSDAVIALTQARHDVLVLSAAIEGAIDATLAGDMVSACLAAEELRAARSACENSLRDAQEVLDFAIDVPLVGTRPESGVARRKRGD